MRVSADGKRVTIEVQFWLDDDGSIRVASKDGQDFLVRVKAEPLKRNGHPSLFRRLRWLLKEAGAPAPK